MRFPCLPKSRYSGSTTVCTGDGAPIYRHALLLREGEESRLASRLDLPFCDRADLFATVRHQTPAQRVVALLVPIDHSSTDTISPRLAR
jgi:hypothetical protein